MATAALSGVRTMLTLPTDAVRQLQWRFADRFDLQMLVQSRRAVWRELRLPGWSPPASATPTSGPRSRKRCWRRSTAPALSAIFMEPEAGRLHRRPQEPGPRAGGIRAGLGGRRRGHGQPGRLPRALAHPRARHTGAGAALQVARRPAAARRRPQAPARRFLPHRAHSLRRRRYRHARAARSASPTGTTAKSPGSRWTSAAASSPTSPIANFVTAAVNSDDPRIKGSCVVILEETDEGTFERGTATKKLVHQLSSTGDPDLQPQGPRQPHRRRLHRQGRRHRSQLQPQRSH